MCRCSVDDNKHINITLGAQATCYCRAVEVDSHKRICQGLLDNWQRPLRLGRN
ncbi:hypothetical protein CSC32_1174 [Pseudomonas aeruginosa]|nr:hypothetical protein CSC32_1174 [Pseudomonas aeruginosa]RCG89728.1 hypothetical protein CSB86_3495 [Pseudomonas aeruginosa]